jgi:maltooligosyltrehalose trehalohydrolase
MEAVGDGCFEVVVEQAAAGSDYRYVLDGERERADPASLFQPAGVFGPSRVEDPGRFAWSDAGWRGVARSDLVIYELHVGTFSPAGTFDGVIGHLERLADLGVTAIELMPVAEFPGARNWGYDGVFPYAAQSTYGGPAALARLVDAAHGAGLAVLIDVVYNHLGPEGNVLGDFGPYFTDRYRTPWGDAINFDGADSDEVRRYFIGSALYWLDDLHADGLRLDAVHAICDFSAAPFLAELAERVHAMGDRLGRPLHVIAESDGNDPRLVRSIEHGGLGLDGLWCEDFHHALHAAMTGERRGYYADFGAVADLAKSLADRFVYEGRYSVFRRRRHGAPARDVAADRFVAFSQNHDQVGNRAAGERLTTLVSPRLARLAAVATFLSPYLPLLFMGEEYGEKAPFLYFVDHHDEKLRRAVRRGRRREFERFAWAGTIPDPSAEATFERSRLDHSLVERESHAARMALYGDLACVRREIRAACDGAPAVVVENDGDWISLRYDAGATPVAWTVLNLGETFAEVVVPPGLWRRRLDGSDARYGGDGADGPQRIDGSERVAVGVAGGSAIVYVRKEVP